MVVKDWWFFVRVALEYDLGLARSYMAGEFEVRPHVKWGVDKTNRSCRVARPE